ncbi:glycoside hydrolase family 32 protein [Lacticigenium naphthae]|uniref:glycoside hydrolase family 32 protein n=1 Tax=Lacticigenium naphthae TaxID=515351 RepID=UPI0003F58A14|nr:glycoside hydrolase family 32 protein [Lacticigenium naphthae]
MTQPTPDKYTVHYHLRAPEGLLNDPNGLIFFNNQYHVFFQWNPEGTTHANKTWGHAISSDLVEWTYLKPALEPTDWFDKNGCYSGSAIEKDGKMFLFYTGNVRNDAGERESYQCLAISEDGEQFLKKGPLFTHPKNYTAHVRDPKVWKDEEEDCYWMILGAQTLGLKGTTILYRSADLLDWKFSGEFTEAYPDFGYMWECPDVLRMKNKEIFLFSPQGIETEGDFYKNVFQTGYLVGDFKNGKFVPTGETFKELDRGFEFYAPQSFEDNKGRTILFGWMGAMEPDVENAVPTRKEGWIHHLTLPREIKWENGQLLQQPVTELQKLRNSQKLTLPDLQTMNKVEFSSSEQEMVCTWKSAAASFDWVLRNEVSLKYNADSKRFTIERTNWLTAERETRSVQLTESLKSMQLFIEDSSLEVYLNNGAEVFSLRYFKKERTNLWTWKKDSWKENITDFSIFELKKVIEF